MGSNRVLAASFHPTAEAPFLVLQNTLLLEVTSSRVSPEALSETSYRSLWRLKSCSTAILPSVSYAEAYWIEHLSSLLLYLKGSSSLP